MGDEQHRDARSAADASTSAATGDLVGEVEAVERLVEDQQPRSWTRAWAISSRCCSPPDSRPIGRSAKCEAPTTSTASGPDRANPTAATPPNGSRRSRAGRRRSRGSGSRTGTRVAGAGSRSPADGPRGSAEHGRVARGERDLAEQRAEQRRLARAVRAEHRRERPRGGLDVDVLPDRLAPEAHPGATELDGWLAHRLGPPRRALCRACSCATCHCSKLSEAGSRVSVIVTTGMPAARAAAVTRWTSGVAFWRL